MRTPPFRIRITAAVTAFVLSATPSSSIGSLSGFYDSVSAFNNATGPQAYHGQTMHVYTGGGLFMRTPQRTYSLWNFAAPTVRAGCGGIDIFGGSFSFINSENLVAMLRNIGQNALGLIFLQGMQALCPECTEIIKFLQYLQQKVNNTNISSCETAQALISASGADKFLEANKRTTTLGSTLRSWFPDYTKAQDALSQDAELRRKQSALKSDHEAGGDKLIYGNLVWRALKRAYPHADDKDLRIVMSVIGSVMFAPEREGMNSRPAYIKHTLDFKSLLGKRDGSEIPKIITCLDGTNDDQCTVTGEENLEGKPFSDIAYNKMMEIYGKILARSSRLSPSDIDFINSTSVPVYKIISTAAALPADSVAHDQIVRNADAIGAELAAAFILKALDEVEKAINGRKLGAAKAEEDELQKISERIRAVRTDVAQQRITYITRTSGIANLMQEVSFLEKAFIGNLSDSVAANMRFTRFMRGGA